MCTDCQESKCNDCIFTTQIQWSVRKNKEGTKRTTTVLAKTQISLLQAKLVRALPTYLLKTIFHFKQNVSTKSSETHFKLRGGWRKAEESLEKERDREKTVLALSV